MKVETVSIEFNRVQAKTEKKIGVILKRHYGLALIGGSLLAFKEKTSSSRVYKASIKKFGEAVIKDSFWYASAAPKAQVSALKTLNFTYQLSEVLRKKGVKLPKIIANKKNLLVTLAGNNYFIISKFMSGGHFASRDREFSSSGQALALFHKKGRELLKENPKLKSQIIKNIPVQMPYEESMAIYNKFLRTTILKSHKCRHQQMCQAVKKNIILLDETIEFINLSGVDQSNLTRGIVHNDFHTNNALFKPNGDFACFLDIDQIGIGPFIWDVGNTLASFISNLYTRNKKTDFKHKISLFLKAYHRENPLPLSEYRLCLAATQRWDMMRILRNLRRHHYENDYLPALYPKVNERFIPRLRKMPVILKFIDDGWLKKKLS